MKVIIRKYESRDIADMVKIWNSVVEDGIAFPQEEYLNETSGAEFFSSQSYCGVAENENGDIQASSAASGRPYEGLLLRR